MLTVNTEQECRGPSPEEKDASARLLPKRHDGIRAQCGLEDQDSARSMGKLLRRRLIHGHLSMDTLAWL